MRGMFTDQGGLFSYIAPDKRLPSNHPLRKVRELVRDVLRAPRTMTILLLEIRPLWRDARFHC